jgi:DivIVA domain-containing protein
MALTGKDVQEAVFTTSRKGYSKDEVDDFLDRVVESIEEYRRRLADLEAQLGIGPAAGERTTAGSDVSAFAGPATELGSATATTGLATAPGGPAATGEPTTQPSATSTSPVVSMPAASSPQTPEEPTAAQDSGHQAGWYPDPWQQASERYYDGKEWTAQTR